MNEDQFSQRTGYGSNTDSNMANEFPPRADLAPRPAAQPDSKFYRPQSGDSWRTTDGPGLSLALYMVLYVFYV